MYQALITQGASLQTYPSSAFNVGTGDFSIMAMVQSSSGGTVLARKGSTDGAGNGGFLLVVNPDGSIKFSTQDGFGYYQVLTGPTSVLDGGCHTVAGIRAGAALSVLCDGVVVQSVASGTASPPLNVDNDLPLTIGCTQQSSEPHNQFLGSVMNVSIWNAALSGDQLVKAAFGRVTGTEPNLQGYWTLDATSNDLSVNDNPASIVGPVEFRYSLGCVWAEAANAYTFYQVTNVPGRNVPAVTVSLTRTIAVPAGAPALACSIMADQDVPAFPAGAQVQLSDPSGHIYNQAQNTETAFATISGGQLWGLMVVDPPAGGWRVTVTAPANSAFHLTFNTVPVTDVVTTSRSALAPLFADVPPQVALSGHAYGGLWDTVIGVAVAAVVGVVAAAAALILSPGTVLAAVAIGIGAFAVVGYAQAAAALPTIAGSNSLQNSTDQVAGMAGFVVAASKLLVMDANTNLGADLLYTARRDNLYPRITASSFDKVASWLIGDEMQLAPVQAAMSSFASGYVSASSHGKTPYLFGWFVQGNRGDLQQVIATSGNAQFTPAMVEGKIIHLLASFCGSLGTNDTPGLGKTMVSAGAVAFFGYSAWFWVLTKEPTLCVAPDMEIDLQLMRGKTCAQAYAAAIAKANATIERLRNERRYDELAFIERNRDALVSPSTNVVYGDPNAKLEIN